MKKLSLIPILLMLFSLSSSAQSILLEAESFSKKGGWVVDQQFMDQMGSPYLMAHDKGKPVVDAISTINIASSGSYKVFVRTFNWTSPWTKEEGAGKFQVKINGKPLPNIVGAKGNCWEWQEAGEVDIKSKTATIALTDLTGFNGRCDAVYLTKNGDTPPSSLDELDNFRRKLLKTKSPEKAGKFDLVVVGGGVAGMCAAATASRLGLKVALINDRPILGGNNSSEIRVHLGGKLNLAPYPNLGNMLREFGHSRIGNAKPASNYEDEKKQKFIDAEENITLFSSTRAINVKMDGDKIKSVITKHIETGKELFFEAPLFSDCTGDGTIGTLAGAEYRMGRESRAIHNEKLAPEVGDKLVMGASVQWYSKDTESKKEFPDFSYGLNFTEESSEKVTMGEWTWETGMNFDQIKDFERIRDYGMMVIYSNWAFLKNKSSQRAKYANRELDWVAYVSGKRESRRLIGDYILNGNDIADAKIYDDGTASTSWSIDLHYPDPKNSKYFPGTEFKSIAIHNPSTIYPVPYRCLYSKNVANLFMAGRNISVTHVALGTTRVMRTTAMLGEVVGMAASICHNHNSLPRSVYTTYLTELKALMTKGMGDPKAPDNQHFN
ncbi:MAG: FAD-dependent oxidoreductase [Rikenellaceae bacterium]